MRAESIHVIINPVSGAGRTATKTPDILESLRGSIGTGFSLCETCEPDDATRSARGAIQKGARRIIVVGGDGTINEAINGIFIPPHLKRSAIELGIINTGTGHGLAQSLKIPASIAEQIYIATNGSVHHIDVGLVTYQHPSHGEQQRLFVNECQIGIGANVVKSVHARHKKFGGLAAYGLGTLKALLSYPNEELSIAFDDQQTLSGRFVGLCVGNGARTAGGIRLTPAAVLDDGLLDVLLIHGQSVAKRLSLFTAIPTGRHIRSRLCTYVQASRINVSSQTEVHVAADGELLGLLPCSLSVLPGALPVCCPPR